MRLLLDTHILLWSMQSPRRLSATARVMMLGASQIYISSASIWEVAIKVSNRKLKIDIDILISNIAESGFFMLEITYAHAAAVANLPFIHRDPFDRTRVFMNILTFSEACASLKNAMDNVCNDHEPMVITRDNGKHVVMLSWSDFKSIQETIYLLGSAKNSRRLMESVTQIKAGKARSKKMEHQ